MHLNPKVNVSRFTLALHVTMISHLREMDELSSFYMAVSNILCQNYVFGIFIPILLVYHSIFSVALKFSGANCNP